MTVLFYKFRISDISTRSLLWAHVTWQLIHIWWKNKCVHIYKSGFFSPFFNTSCCSVAKSCPTLCDHWTAAYPAPLSFTISWSLLKFMSIELVMLSNHHILCLPLLLFLQSFPALRSYFHKSVLPIRWPKYWSFSYSNSPSNEYSGLISIRTDWFDLL